MFNSPNCPPREIVTDMDMIARAMETERPDLDALCKAMGIRIEDRALHETVCGWMTPEGGGGWLLVRNAAHRNTRRRFTTAHMIGHHHFHQELMGAIGCNDGVDYRQMEDVPGYNPRILERHEQQASRFAVRLTMPTAIIGRLQDDGLSVFQIADRLEISVQAMAVRLKGLAAQHV